MFSNPKSIQASVTLLERLAIILDKSTEADMRNLVLPLLFNSLESKMSQIQVRDDMMNSNNLFLIHVLKIWKSALQFSYIVGNTCFAVLVPSLVHVHLHSASKGLADYFEYSEMRKDIFCYFYFKIDNRHILISRPYNTCLL